MSTVKKIKSLLKESVTIPQEKATAFFKTSAGDYAQDDQFIGVKVPTIRIIAKQFATLPLEEILNLLQSPINEERLLALFVLVDQYKKADTQTKEKLYQFYLNNLKYVNNWNLVDSSAHLVIGAHLFKKDKELLFTLAQSKSMWERRIAIVSTWFFIRNNDLEWTFKIATLLLNDTHDLIHKATGWMLREAGERNQNMLAEFLDQHAHYMPRTMLRYAIEKFSEEKRKHYLMQKKVRPMAKTT
jgi:3-methyladenine DNA glycosylase AlkD